MAKIGDLPIIKKHFGILPIVKEVLNGSVIYEESSSPFIHCVVSGLGSETPSDVTFTKDARFTMAGLGIEEVTYNGDTFIKIPTMYRKINSTSGNQITSFTISNAKEDDNFAPYSCFVKENGSTVMDYILIGKYLNTSSSSMVSTSETTFKD